MIFDPPNARDHAAATADILTFSGRRAAPRRLALIGGFAPRKCGIATFTTDIFEQLAAHQPQIAADVWALETAAGPAADDRVRGRIRADRPADYAVAARKINEGGYDAVWLQHEYGIFGGDCGEMVLELAERIAAPLILTLHTVLSEPGERQRAILARLIAIAARIMVMSRHSRDLLVERYGVAPEHITVIPHGAPDRQLGGAAQAKAALGLSDRAVLMTFGLLGPGKGIEAMIGALPAIVAHHPEALYRVVGATHPNLVAAEGEAYRERLEARAIELGVGDNVVFDNRFLETDELLDQLDACDIYVTPYPNLQQSTSGTLSYAVALGKAVVSTPFVHARELLADGVGALVEPASSAALADAVLGLLDHPEALAAMQQAAYARGRETIWPRFAAASAALVEQVVAKPSAESFPLAAIPGSAALLAMSDGTGMLQHSIGIVPDRRHGYCLDDNIRALLLMLRADGIALPERQRLASTYASFVQHAWNEERQAFRNFMNFDRSWCEDVGSEDSNGRTAWILGELWADGFGVGWDAWARPWYERALDAMEKIDSPRSLAFAMLGAAAVLRAGHDHSASRDLLERGGAFLHRLLDAARRPDWAWFEAVLGYDNPRLPQALLEAGVVIDRADWREAGLESLTWIGAQQRAEGGHFRPVGSEGFGREYAKLPFDQQPLEAWAAVEAAASAYAVSHDPRWIEHAEAAYRWFLGDNDRGVVLADIASGRCRDGVTPRGANENCGAESILAFHLAYYALAALTRATHDAGPGDRIGRTARTAVDTARYP